MKALALTRGSLLAILLLSSLAALADPPATPPGKVLRYMMVLKTGTAESDEPDIAKFGGRKEKRWKNRRVIEVPLAALDALKKHPSVAFFALVNDGSETDAPKYVLGEGEAKNKVRSEVIIAPPVWFSGDYQYDGSGNIKAIGGDDYNYDLAQRLTSALVNGESILYKYDSFGNLIERKIGTVTTSAETNIRTNQLTAAKYDAAGNQVATPGDTETYGFDGANMMVERKSLVSRRYIYTADDERIGVRVGSTEWDWSIRDFSGRVIARFESEGASELSSWYWAESYHYRDGLLTSGLLTEEFTMAGARASRDFHLDHLGTPRLMTNQDAQKIAAHDYHPFGREQTPFNQEMTDWLYRAIEPMQFTGHERDYIASMDSNRHDYLDYMHARYYNPSVGRFLSVDPVLDVEKALGEPQRWNRYSYVTNRPLRYVDPDGRDKLAAWLLGPNYAQVSTWDAIFSRDTISEVNTARQVWAEDHRQATHGFSPVPTTKTETAFTAASIFVGPLGGPVRRFLGTSYSEAKTLVGAWGKGTFPTLKKSLLYHFEKWGAKVGADDMLTYLRKAWEFNRNLRGAERTVLENGSVRFQKKGFFVIQDIEGNIVSFGRATK